MFQTVATCVYCLTILQSAQYVSMNEVHKMVTYNAGLVNFIPKLDERAAALPNVLARSEADVICLQEVFSGEHIQSITEKVKSEYPYSYSYLHGDRIQFHRNINRYAKSPCTGVLTYISGLCIILRCGLQGSKENFLECAHFKCNALLLNSIECTTCVGVFAPSIKKVLRNCIVFTPAFNLPGLLVLSKVPLRNNMYTQFNSEFKVLPRFYLTSNVENIGNVLCTHMTTDTDAKYLETKSQYMFKSWAERNKMEAQSIGRIVTDKQRIILLGDLNTGPSVPSSDIKSVFPESYKHLQESGLESPYVSTIGKRTFRNEPVIIDHVMHKGFTAVAARRLFDNDVDNTSLSDHYGVEVWFSSD